jgi:hypothetical protein
LISGSLLPTCFLLGLPLLSNLGFADSGGVDEITISNYITTAQATGGMAAVLFPT